jgi:pimeloyl-ACP methyl ester carboxylesterase
VSDPAVRPFRIRIPEAQLEDLRRRLGQARWPEPETVPDDSQGVRLHFLRELCDYWGRDYDWRRAEERLNSFPQFRTEIDGLGIHFLHVRSPDPDALALILTHGWPGSVVEFLDVIAPLTDSFHVICPSLPGYGFSDKPQRTGWDVHRTARAWIALMERLGYARYGAAGSDWGTSITASIGVQDAGRVAGIHLVPPLVAPDPATMDDLTAYERDSLESLRRAQESGDGYSLEQSTRPQTIGYGLVDSPVALCAWIVEKFLAWTDGELFEVIGRDRFLDNLMLYWLTGTGASAARMYWESFAYVQRLFTDGEPERVGVPAGCSVFPKENPRPSRRWAERRFTDIRYWNEPERGGHFAAFEQPELFVHEIRSFFRIVR